MTTRNIINNFNSGADQKLYEDLINEFVQTWGIDVYYLPRTSQSAGGFDLLFGDDPTKKYDQSYQMEMYIQTVDNFEGGEIYSKFGLVVKKQVRLLLPTRAFQREVPTAVYPRPREGDLVWMPNFKALFEIKYVDEEHFFYDFGKTDFYGFNLICEKFRYNNEVVSTGVDEIDSTVDSVSYVYKFQMANTGANGTYQAGEVIYQTANGNPHGAVTANAIVSLWNLPTGILELKTINGLFVPNVVAFGATSNANWNVVSYNLLNSVNHLLSDNQDIEVASNTILNWSEGNPFNSR